MIKKNENILFSRKQNGYAKTWRWLIRALISNNFGRRKNDPAKDRKALETYVSLRGYKSGEIGRNHFQKDQNGLSEKSTLDEIAKELNMSKTNLKRALRIERNFTYSMKELQQTA